jgi:methionyl-tRNA formyltransferase
MSLTVKELRIISDEEIIKLHDKLAQNADESVDYCLNELARRHQNRQTETMLSYTKEVRSYTRYIMIMTGIVTLATIINLAVAFFCHR